MKTGFNRQIPIGQVVYDHSFYSLQHITCLWCFYPIFRLTALLKQLKIAFYHYLNTKGIMQTRPGHVMSWKDLCVNDWLICNISKGVVKP